MVDEDWIKGLTEQLDRLSHPVRLKLLAELRTPKVLSEIEVTKPEDVREKNLARQTVKHHLDHLVEAETVSAREVQRSYGATTEYLVNNQRLFALSEEIRSLARLEPSDDPGQDTLPGDRSLEDQRPEGPHLVLLKGVPEGRIFELEGLEEDETRIVGRRRAAGVPLSFDPYVSTENTGLERSGDEFVVFDLAGSKNGTVVNGRRLGPEERVVLATGDVIGVGKSTLIYRA